MDIIGCKLACGTKATNTIIKTCKFCPLFINSIVPYQNFLNGNCYPHHRHCAQLPLLHFHHHHCYSLLLMIRAKKLTHFLILVNSRKTPKTTYNCNSHKDRWQSTGSSIYSTHGEILPVPHTYCKLYTLITLLCALRTHAH